MELAARFEELTTRVLAPLVLGGEVCPVLPIGERLALGLAQSGLGLEPELASRLDLVRVRRARELAPVDTLPPIGPAEIALAAAYSDLLQVTNPELTGAFTRGRRARLLASVHSLCAHVRPPNTVGGALARYATFRRAFDAIRTDASVRWWTGHATFRGAEPPPRLLHWRSLRRVEVHLDKVNLPDMGDDLGGLRPAAFHEALAAWLERSPLNDLASVDRKEPPFRWTGATLGLLTSPEGRQLALRAVSRTKPRAAAQILERAAEDLDPGPTLDLVTAFLGDVLARQA